MASQFVLKNEIRSGGWKNVINKLASMKERRKCFILRRT